MTVGGQAALRCQPRMACRRRACTRHSRVSIIFITAFPEDRIRRRAEAAGVVGFFSMSVDGHTIVDCLNAALSGVD